MSTHDIGSDLLCHRSLSPVARAANTYDGASVDRLPQGQAGYVSGVLHVTTGVDSGTPTSFTVNAALYESDDDSSFTAVLDEYGNAVAITAITAEDSSAQVAFRAKRLGKYLRARMVTAFVGGTAPTILSSANIILGGSTQR